MGPLEIAQMRIESLQKLNVLRKELEGTEEKLHANLPEHLRPILKGKRLTLFEKMATDVKSPAIYLHNEIREGFRLVGTGSRSNAFKPEFKPAQLDEKELMKKAKFIRPAIIGKLKSQQLPDYQSDLIGVTRGEVTDRHWLEGPRSFEEVCNDVGEEWIPVTRFAVQQKNKLRPIDNFAENFVNRLGHPQRSLTYILLIMWLG